MKYIRGKIIRMSTVGMSLDIFCRGLLRELSSEGYDVVALSSPDQPLEDLGRREGVRTVGVEMKRDISLFHDLRSLLRLIVVLRRERPQMLHTMTPKAGLLGMLAARTAGIPVRVHTFTGLLFPTATGLRKSILKLTDRITCLCATHILPEGEGVAADLRKARITRKPLRVLGNGNVRGVDLDHYAPGPELTARGKEIRKKLGIPESSFTFVFAGRFVADKGLPQLIEAFKGISGHDCRLVLVGDTEGSSPAMTRESLASVPGIHLSDGWVDDMRPWMSMADALVFPSLHEGFPNVVLEAGAMCLPSIVTDINGSREIIDSPQLGFVVPPATVAPLREAMVTVMSLSSAERARMGKAARDNIAAKYSAPFVRACLKNFYSTVLNT